MSRIEDAKAEYEKSFSEYSEAMQEESARAVELLNRNGFKASVRVHTCGGRLCLPSIELEL